MGIILTMVVVGLKYDEDSANTDAQTLTYNVTAPVGGFGNSTNNDMGNVPGGKIQSVSVEIHTAHRFKILQ